MRRSDAAFHALCLTSVAVFGYLIWIVFTRVPTAQAAAGGLAQKIFYFHVPSAYAMYLCGVVCLVTSAGYLLRMTDGWNAWARASAECATLFGALVLTSGPLWAKKAWGVYWTWDPQLTVLLLTVLIYAATVILRVFSSDGEAERKFAAALGVLGTVNIPIIHYSVQKWGGNHPTVMRKGGGGLHPDMRYALMVGFVAMTLLAVLLLWSRARVLRLGSRLARAEERALAAGAWEGR